MPPFSLHTLPFWLHGLIELPSSMSFFFNPERKLCGPIITSDPGSTGCHHCSDTVVPKPGGAAILRQYGVLLFVSVLIAVIFAIRKVDITSRLVAAALTIYHVAPIIRATLRLRGGETAWLPDDIGGPWVHLSVHIACFLALGSLALGAFRNDYKLKIPTKRD